MSDPSWLIECQVNITKIPGAAPCEQSYCEAASTYMALMCTCAPPYSNGCPNPPTPGCCAYTASSPVVMMRSGGNCYCCCGSATGGDGTVAVGGGESRPLSEIAVGDRIQAALDLNLETWALVAAEFSAGTGIGAPGIEISLGGPAPRKIVVDPDQLLLVAGRLKRASRLVAGVDELTGHDRDAVPVLALAAVTIGTPRHRIATSNGPATEVAGHLIIIDEVIGGDYALQLADLDTLNPAVMAPGHARLPEFGTSEYTANTP
jgi:hypothetical protein